MEDNDKVKNKNSSNIINKMNINNSIKSMLPREIQNANSLIFSQINLNKYSWEEDG